DLLIVRHHGRNLLVKPVPRFLRQAVPQPGALGSCRPRSLANFPYLEYFAESHYSESIETNGKTSPQNRTANHRNTESHAAPAQERGRAHPRVPDRVGGRAADRRLQRQSPAAS